MGAILIPRVSDFSSLERTHADFHESQFNQNRSSLLENLRDLSSFYEIASCLHQDTLYRVIIPEGGLLQFDPKTNLYRGVEYTENGIKRHAKLTEVGPNLMDIAKTVGSQVLLISIAMQLSRVEKLIEGLYAEMRIDRIAEISSGVDQFEKAMLCDHTDHRNKAIFHAIQSLHTGLHKTIADLGRQIAKAPSPEKVIWDYVWPWNTRAEEAAKVMGPAQESFLASLMGIKTLAECYSVLGEMKAASKTLSDYFDKLQKCNISEAAEKARLVKRTGSFAPEAAWETFIKVHPSLRDRLLPFCDTNMKQHSFEIEFIPSELQGGQ